MLYQQEALLNNFMTDDEKLILILDMVYEKYFRKLPITLRRGFDLSSRKMLDEKIDMLKRLKNGESILDIDPEYKLFELFDH